MAQYRQGAQAGMAAALSVTSTTSDFSQVTFLRRNLRAAIAMIQSPLRELSVVLVDDATMSQLHQRFMNRRGPTDVLTFPLELDGRGRALTGEIVICLPEAHRRAKSERIP